MKHFARMLIVALVALLLLENSPTIPKLNGRPLDQAQKAYKRFAGNIDGTGQGHDPENNTNHLPDDSQDKTCRSDEIKDYLLEHGLVPSSQQLQERALLGATPEVRIIYLVPSDMQPRPEVPIALTNGIKHLQRFYWEQMGNGRTFTLHDPIVETIRSSHDTKWFYTNPAGDNPSLYLWFNSINDASAKFFDPDYAYAIYVEINAPGQATGGAGGIALLPEGDVLGMIGQHPTERNVCRWVGGLGHELGHALGLGHPPECDSHQATDDSFPCQSLMYLGYINYPNTHFVSNHKDQLNQSTFIASIQLSGPSYDCSDLLPFSISINSPSQTINRGAFVNYVINVQGAFGYAQPVDLSTSISPPDSTIKSSLSSNRVSPGSDAILTITTTLDTLPAEYTVSTKGKGDGIERTTMTRLAVITGPSISSVNFNGTKKLTVSGAKFGSAVHLVINNADKTDFITSVSDAVIKIKGKAKKLGLKAGDNSVQVFDTSGAASNIFILRI